MAHARRHHLRWFIIDVVLFVSSVVFFFIPGPNLVAYYFAFRFIGHLQSWRGARQAMDVIQWTFEPDSGLAELASLVERAARRARAARRRDRRAAEPAAAVGVLRSRRRRRVTLQI